MQSDKSARVKEYINSGLYIHDYLVTYIDGMLLRLRDAIHKGLRVNPVVMFWPRTAIKDDAGKRVDRVVMMDMTEEMMRDKLTHIRGGIERTGAYGFLLLTPEEEEVKAVLETPNGTETWHLKKERHGDITVLKEPVKVHNQDSFGVLWTQG